MNRRRKDRGHMPVIPATQEMEAGGAQVSGWYVQISKIQSQNKRGMGGCGCNSVEELLPHMCEALGSVPGTNKAKSLKLMAIVLRSMIPATKETEGSQVQLLATHIVTSRPCNLRENLS